MDYVISKIILCISCTVSLESMKTRSKLGASYQSYCSFSMNNTDSAVIRGDLFLIKSQSQKNYLLTQNIADMKTKYITYFFCGNRQRNCARAKWHSERWYTKEGSFLTVNRIYNNK